MFAVPPSSSTPRIVSLMCAACVLAAASGAGAALAGRVARRRTPPPPALRALLAKLSPLYTTTPAPDPVSHLRLISFIFTFVLHNILTLKNHKIERELKHHVRVRYRLKELKIV